MSDLDNTQDWGEIEALRASLREHMAEIHRLRAAGRQALGALQFGLPLIKDYGDEQQLAIHHKALAELTEYAMQRLTDEQQMIERGTKAWADVPDATAWVNDLRGNEPVTDCHEKAADHIADANKMIEPVAYVTGYYEGRCVIKSVEPVLLPVGMALYRSPPTINEMETVDPVAWMVYALDGQSAFVTNNPADFTPQHRALPLYTAPPKREPHEFAGVKIKEIRIPKNMLMRFDGDVLVIERAHGIGGEE